MAMADQLKAFKDVNAKLHGVNELLRREKEIETIKSYVELARSRGDERRVEDLQEQLSAKLDEFRALKTNFESEFPKMRRW